MRHCFHEFSFELLLEVAHKRFNKKIPTLDICKQYESAFSREAILTLALLDLNKKTLALLAKSKGFDVAHVLDCRKRIVEKLIKEGISLPHP